MMTMDMAVVIAILVVAIVFFVKEWLRVDVVALCIVIALLVTKSVTTEEALAGFSSTAVISIAALFIVGGAVFQTGLAAMIADRILKIAGTSEIRLLLVLMAAMALLSAFISSTGVVALMLPAVLRLAHRSKISPSKLLMPMAFGSLLGGTLSLIGTPPNIIVSDTLLSAGYEPFSFFSFTPIGVVLLVCGVAYMFFIGRHLLPDNKPTESGHRMETPAELFSLYRLPDDLFRLRVHNQSKACERTIQDLCFRKDFNVNIVNITRASKTIHHLTPDFKVQEEDVIVVKGLGNDVGRLAGVWDLAIMANKPIQQGEIITNEVGISEVLLRPRSTLIGKSLADVRFGSTYQLTVLNVERPGTTEPLNLKEDPLKFGDVLLVQGEWKNIFALKRLRHDFIVMGEPEAIQMGAFSRQSHVPITLTIVILMVLAIMFNIASLTLASLTAAVALVIAGCVTMDEAYDSIDWKSLVMIAGLLPMSTALINVGLVDLISDSIAQDLGSSGTIILLGGVFLLTGTLTQLLSNTATALLIAPVALTTAQSLNVDPHAFMMAVGIAASMAFLSPVASPVNTLVMTSGNYRFSDYARVGFPLFVLTFIVTMVMLMVLYPL